MEPNQPDSFQNNWTQVPQQGKELPGSLASMILGIVALVCSTVLNCCYFIGVFPGLITSIIGLVLGSKAMKLYNSEPGIYSEKSYKNAKAGKIMSLIALIICGLATLLLIFAVIFGMMSEFDRYNRFN